MWEEISHTLQPLTKWTSSKVTFKWTDVAQKLFNKIKGIVDQNKLLPYIDFIGNFDIYKD